MHSTILKSAALAGVATLALAAGAHANGFARGTADTDILYEEGNFNFRAGATFVSPTRDYTAHGNPANVGTNAYQDYVIPSVAFKLDVTDNFRCAGTYTTPYGGDVRYAAPTLSAKTREEFTVDEFAATCAVRFQAGRGNLYVLGGVYQENFDYFRQNNYAALGLGTAELELAGKETGYRLGVGYDIPEIALRTQLLYRSGTDYGASGMLTAPAGVLAGALRNAGVPDAANPFAALGATTSVDLPALGIGSLPQTVELRLQSGIAPGWLAFGSIKWSDWSALTTLDVREATSGLLLSRDNYFWDNGWTITGGVGHAFNDMVSGAVSLTWDQGVTTGWDLSSDTWTLAGGVSVKDSIGGELRAGVGISYLTAAEETQYAAGANAAVDSGWAYAASVSYKVKW